MTQSTPAHSQPLKRLKDTGRRLILVTGRQVDDLTHAFADVAVFDIVVAENGGVLFDPASDEKHSLATPPSPAFIQRLMDLGIKPISFGRVVVATWVPHHTAVTREAPIHPTDRVLMVGESRSGKSQLAKLLTEQMVDHAMEFACWTRGRLRSPRRGHLHCAHLSWARRRGGQHLRKLETASQ